MLLLICMALPAAAIARLPVDPRIAASYAVAVSLVAYWSYSRDKRKAQARRWRISEKTLHLWELVGGWPGAFVAQRRLRHKCSKLSYQVIFWSIVLIYQYAAVDILRDGKVARVLADALRAAGG